jgi:hypothetical protein
VNLHYIQDQHCLHDFKANNEHGSQFLDVIFSLEQEIDDCYSYIDPDAGIENKGAGSMQE